MPISSKPLISSTRQDLNLELLVTEGTLPTDIYGCVLINSSSGTVNSALPYPKQFSNGKNNPEWGSSVLAGDGYIFKVDFNTTGKAFLKGKLIKDASFALDKVTKHGSKYSFLGFRNWGIARISIFFGAREQLATAVMPVLFKDQNQRLLVTSDLGRPYEIDGKTLNTLNPIGNKREYLGINFLPFTNLKTPILQTTAHPVFDPLSKQLFMTTYTRSLPAILDLPELVKLFFKCSAWGIGFLEKIANKLTKKKFGQSMMSAKDQVFLLAYNGSGKLQKWQVTDQNGKDIVIEQCIHQMGVTEDYILFSDSAFKLTPDILFPIDSRLRSKTKFHLWLRQHLTKAQEAFTNLYIIKKTDLEKGNTVVAKMLKITPESVHFVTDYSNPNQQITLYSANNSASCLAEWVRYYDTLSNGQPVTEDIIGLLSVGSMDVNRIGKVVIDAQKMSVISQTEYSSTGKLAVGDQDRGAHTWVVGLPTYAGILSASNPPAKIKNIYWQCSGLDQNRLTQFIKGLYRDYPNRVVSVVDVQKFTSAGVPEQVGRLDTESMKIVDYFQFPMGVNLHSVQFVPKKQATAGISDDMNGYIFCMLIKKLDAKNYAREIWVLDAANLKNGGVKCKLSHSELDYAFTLHSVWVDDVSPDSDYEKVSGEEEIREILGNARKFYPIHNDLFNDLEKEIINA